MKNARAVLEKAEWLMRDSNFEEMLAGASFENVPEPLKVEEEGERKTIFLHGPIVKTHDFFSIIEGAVSVDEFVKTISELTAEADLDIDSGGGEALAAMPMVDAIRNSPFPINARVTGACASLGYMVACATGRP